MHRPASGDRSFAARIALAAALAVAASGCAPQTDPAAEPAGSGEPRPAWSIALHGGAGGLARDTPAERVEAYLAALESALRVGVDSLEAGRSAVDVVERVIRELEDDPLFNAGRGAVLTAAGTVELDASIMDGRTLGCGGAASVRGVRHPITLARRVMDGTPHVLMVGAGAEAFARGEGLRFEPPEFFETERRRRALDTALGGREQGGGTVGVVVRDASGHLAAGTSTGGLTGKLPGRVGDSPLVGAGTFADDRSCAVSGTGRGEEYIRHGVARRVGWLVERDGRTLDSAVHEVVHELLRPGDGGVIAVDRHGAIAMAYNTSAMFRGAADAAGRFEVAIWD